MKPIIKTIVTGSALFIIITFISNCGTTDKKTNTPTEPKRNGDFSEDFAHEGFISKDTYRVIIVKPVNGPLDIEDLKKQAKSKALASLKRHLASEGGKLTDNVTAELLNLINSYGKISEHRVKDHTLIILDINRTGCKSFVERLGR